MKYIEGIDVSKHQGKDVDFKATMSASMVFAFVKITEGVGHTDPEFRNNWKKLVALDGEYIRGVYHFARPDSVGGRIDGENEAKYMVKVIKRNGHWQEGCLPPALDFEKYSEWTHVKNVEWVKGFIHVVEAEMGRPPIIYTGRNIWKFEMGSTQEFVSYPLWQVNYSSKAQHPVKMVWDRWTFWQWSGGKGKEFDHRYWLHANGKMPGIPSGYCDVNRFNGTRKELWEMALLTCE